MGASRGTSAGDYPAVWRDIFNIFTAEQAGNVRWAWTANVRTSSLCDVYTRYPGDECVDVLGVVGYNWGTISEDSRWIGPEALFGPMLGELCDIRGKLPIFVAKVGCAEAGGSKPDGIVELIGYLDSQPEVFGYVWCHHGKEADWRMNNSAEATIAMASALRDRRGKREGAM